MASDQELLAEEGLKVPEDLQKNHSLERDDLDGVLEPSVCLFDV
eukprot:CAMPEP_0170607502 /NCGR_PEP_ID=MMETSP0224-20130122/21089_1 /TAXON_ID=285029 /ORGANISM="Togula jolla, Strain CCCM 725" /LENGTH=43 /DNA_ID= /DNA_START= /DNA_END= /DNA_ORIENTATION=